MDWSFHLDPSLARVGGSDPILSRYLVLVGGLSGPLRRPVPTLVLLPGFSGFRRCLVRSRFAVPSGTHVPACN